MSDLITIEDEMVEVEVSSDPNLKRPRKLTSKVWDDFKKITGEDGVEIASCNHCKWTFTGASSSGTTHLKNHLHRCPRRKHGDIGQQMLAITKSKGSSSGVRNFKFDHERSKMDLVKMIIKHEYSFNMVEHEYFQTFVNNLQPMFKMVSRNTVRADVLVVYKEEKKKLYDSFDQLSSRISLTIDLWTSSEQNIGYCCVTVHFIDEGWDLKKKLLSFISLESPHDAETLVGLIKDVVLEWNIDKKLFSITVDNASTNDAMVRELRRWLEDQNLLPLGGSLFHIRCSAHILNLIVQDGLQEIKEIIKNVRKSVRYVRSTPQKKQKFKNALNQVKLFGRKGVILDVKTRWNSTFLMLERALELREAFVRLQQIDREFNVNLSKEEWDTAQVVCGCLKVFYEVTCAFSGYKYPTANLFFPYICKIHKHLLDMEKSEHAYVRDMAFKMKLKFEKYWDSCSLVLAIATVLDPRFKMDLVEYFYGELYGTNADVYVMRIRTAVVDLFTEYSGDSHNVMQSSFDVSDSTCSSSQPPCNSSSNDMLMGFQNWYKRVRSATIRASEKSELDRYLDDTIFPCSQEFDILDWWQVNSPKFPALAKMARDILAVPVSTVASESTFSAGGRLIDDTRSSLTPEIVEALICARDWLEVPKKKNSNDNE